MSPQYGSAYPPVETIRKAIDASLPGAVTGDTEHRGEVTLIVVREQIREVCRFLRDSADWQFALLADVTAADWPKRERRFDVVYNLYSVSRNLRLRLKVQVSEDEPVPSVVPLWASANWAEREVFDMFGVRFEGHPGRYLALVMLPLAWLVANWPLRPGREA